jgi:hypothetical protein
MSNRICLKQIFNYLLVTNEDEFGGVFAGTSVSTDVTLGFISLGKSYTSETKTPYKPNGNATIHNLGFGIGAGYTNGISNTWYTPIYKP